MNSIPRQILKLAVILILIQFFSPCFLPSTGYEISDARSQSIHTQHNSVTVPFLLKEKDEKEHDEFSSESNLSTLLDLNIHSFNLTASHTTKNIYCSDDRWYDPQPTLFVRNSAFLI
jgi:hypothetical protein